MCVWGGCTEKTLICPELQLILAISLGELPNFAEVTAGFLAR